MNPNTVAGERGGRPLTTPPDALADSAPLANAFRAAMRTWASSVAVVAVDCGGQTHGATATAVASLSTGPPTVLVSLHTEGRTRALVACAGALSVSVLGAGSAALSDHFGGRSRLPGVAADRFASVAHHPGATGAPVLDAAIASLEGTVAETWEHADHTVFVVAVAAARVLRPAAAPLVYHDRQYRGLVTPTFL